MLGDAMMPSESETVELKKYTAQLGRVLKAACAFSNHKGGTIYFGINDHGEIVGQDVSDATLKNISSKIRQKIKPEIIPEITIDDKTLKELNERQKSVIEYLKEKDKTISNKEYQVLFGILRNTASTDLNGLVEKGIIKRTGERGREVQDICSNNVQKLCTLCKNCAKTVQKNVVVSWIHNNAIDINDIGGEYNHRGTQRIDLKTLCPLWLNPVAFTAYVGSIQPQQNCAKNKNKREV